MGGGEGTEDVLVKECNIQEENIQEIYQSTWCLQLITVHCVFENDQEQIFSVIAEKV